MNHPPQDRAPAPSRPARPRIGITMGDPAGIGPEVVLKAVAEEEVRTVCQPVIIGDAQFLGGYTFPGHTEFLAYLTGSDNYAMGFVGANLRVVLVSTHVPLSEAIALVRRERVEKRIRLA